MAIHTYDIKNKKEYTITALESVLKTIKESDEVSEAHFIVEDEFDKSIKDGWDRKYSTGWHGLSMKIRYRVNTCGKNES